MGYSGYSGYSGYPQLQNPRIGPAGKSPCEVARELRDQAQLCPWRESNPWGSVLRVICVLVTITLSYNSGCTIAYGYADPSHSYWRPLKLTMKQHSTRTIGPPLRGISSRFVPGTSKGFYYY